MEDPERPLDLEGWLNQELYGYVERYDRVDAVRSTIVFDLVRARDVEKVLLDEDPPTYSLAKLAGVIAVVETIDRSDAYSEGETPEGSWRSVQLGSGTPADIYPELDAAPAPSRLSHKPLLKQQTEKLTKAFSISKLFRTASIGDIQTGIDARLDEVAVYNVGQGNCSALCGPGEQPRLYFDVGGGCLQNTRTYLRPLRFCTRENPKVVLSHWDFDHWFSAFKVPALAQLEWLVPDQGAVGRRTLAFAVTLTNASFWPRGYRHSWKGGEIVECTGTTRNDSGLAMFATVDGRNILLPADARFNFIPPPTRQGALAGLVATHHGSNHLGSPIPRPAPNGKLAYSFGHGNSFHHPGAGALALYESEGWRAANTRYSPHGHIWLGRNDGPIACGRRCDLETVQ